MSFLNYNKNIITYAKELRNEATFAEVLLWMKLKAGKMEGIKFNRQKPIGNYIADFYAKKINLVIEVDGITHEEIKVYRKDKEKVNYFNGLGLTVLRFSDEEVKFNMVKVLKTIKEFIESQREIPLTPRQLTGGIPSHLHPSHKFKSMHNYDEPFF